MGLRPFPCNIVSTLEKDVKSYKEGDYRGHGCTSNNVKQLEPATHCFLETGGDIKWVFVTHPMISPIVHDNCRAKRTSWVYTTPTHRILVNM